MKSLDRKTWQRLAPLLDEALELPTAKRAAYFDRVLGDEPELRRVLAELVEAEQGDEDLLDTPAAGLAGPGEVETIPAVEGYERLREIGRGGMGVVYHAIRRGEGYEQQVALKVVRSGADDAGLQQRFQQERKILARLEHPNIARLVDGGTTTDGRSYFAMEYVDGEAITSYADRRRLRVPERLRLFEDVCSAVAFAQQHLIVHRDLKPSNILVDSQGRVRLLDFGIARLVDPENETASNDMTIEGSRLLTPEYAAPEQLRGEPPSTATDVYALGVVLYQLLSGRHPLGHGRDAALEFALGSHDTEWLPRAVARDHRVVRADGTVEVITGRMVAAARGLSPRALRRMLKGELATITAKALQREPEARYPSAEALLSDLVRHREGQPILAEPPSWGYRTRKYLRRHRTMVTAATLVLIALGTGLGLSLWQARVAQREAERAGRAYDFLAGLFQDAHPDAAQGTDYTATQLLERGATRLADAWPDDPEARGALQRKIATILTDRGDYDSGARMLRGALARDGTVNRVPLTLTLARLELHRGNPQTADSLLTAIVASGQPLSDVQEASLMESSASIHYQMGAYAEAESLMHAVIAWTAESDGRQSDAYASDLSNLAIYQAAQAHYDDAERSQLAALEIERANHPGNSTDVALILHNLGDLYFNMEQNEDAKRYFGEAVAMRRVLYPDGHDRLAESLRGLAMAHRDLGELDAADSLLSISIEMTAATVGEHSQTFARQLNAHAILAYSRGDYVAARERFERARAIYEEELGPTHPTTLTITNNLATVQKMTGELEAAERSYRQVLQRRREVLGDRHADVAYSYNSVGLVLRQMGRPEEAIAMHREALDRYLEIYGEEHGLVATTRTYLGSALREAGLTDEALVELRTALAYREEHLPAAHRDLIDTRIGLGRALLRAGEWSETIETMEQVEREVAESTNTPEIWAVATRAARGLALARLGRVEEGRAMAEAACERLISEYGRDDYRTQRALGYLGQIDER